MTHKASLVLAVSILPLLAGWNASKAGDAAFTKTTHVFKTVGNVKIHADVHRAADTQVRPVLVWLHGGALIMGSRTGVPKNLLDLCKKEGYALVSFDYRLAPEVKLPDIIADVKDAFRWLHQEGAKALHVDLDRVVVSGGSAGGYLTMMTGICVTPRPRALVAYYGYGDVDGDWYTKPNEHYRKTRKLVGKEEAYAAVGDAVITESSQSKKNRGQFYMYCRQNGLWTREVTGFDPEKDRARLDPFCPVRNISKDYPPIIMIHGTRDTDVPYQLSANMAKELARHKVAHELVTVVNGEHGFGGADAKDVAAAHEKALTFIRSHLKK